MFYRPDRYTIFQLFQNLPWNLYAIQTNGLEDSIGLNRVLPALAFGLLFNMKKSFSKIQIYYYCESRGDWLDE